MSVLRQLNNPQADFVMIPRRLCALQLSAEAVGLLVIVAAAPAGADLSAEWIETACGCKRDKRQRIMRELIGAGLLRVRSDQAGDGRWSKVYVFDWAVLLTPPKTEKPASVDQHRDRENRRRKTRSSRQPENPVIEKQEDSLPGASPTAGTAPGRLARAKSSVRNAVAQLPDLAPCNEKARTAALLGLPYRDVSGQWRRPVGVS